MFSTTVFSNRPRAARVAQAICGVTWQFFAVNSGLFPLYEVFDGKRYRVNYKIDDTDPGEYYEIQRRFKMDEIDMEAVRAQARESFDRLNTLAETWPAHDGE